MRSHPLLNIQPKATTAKTLSTRKYQAIILLALFLCFLAIFSDAYSARNNKSNLYSSSKMAEHSEATLALAKQESAEHMHGMKELYNDMRKKPLIVKAYALDDPKAPADAMVVHFVRHGQGFHNLMADMASSEGREWVQVNTISSM